MSGSKRCPGFEFFSRFYQRLFIVTTTHTILSLYLKKIHSLIELKQLYCIIVVILFLNQHNFLFGQLLLFLTMQLRIRLPPLNDYPLTIKRLISFCMYCFYEIKLSCKEIILQKLVAIIYGAYLMNKRIFSIEVI